MTFWQTPYTNNYFTIFRERHGTRTPKDPVAGEGLRETGQTQEAAGTQCQRPEKGGPKGTRSCVCRLQGEPSHHSRSKFIDLFYSPWENPSRSRKSGLNGAIELKENTLILCINNKI